MEIENHFLETIYVVHTSPPTKLVLGEMPILLLRSNPILVTWAFITAHNPMAEKISKEQNDLNNKQLENELIALGFSFYNGVGASEDGTWSEDSFFIINIDFETAKNISIRYHQLAFLYGDIVHGNQLFFTNC